VGGVRGLGAGATGGAGLAGESNKHGRARAMDASSATHTAKRPDLSGMTATANHACKLQEMIKDHLAQYNLLGITDTTEER
jgi:hypothetical protein